MGTIWTESGYNVVEIWDKKKEKLHLILSSLVF